MKIERISESVWVVHHDGREILTSNPAETVRTEAPGMPVKKSGLPPFTSAIGATFGMGMVLAVSTWGWRPVLTAVWVALCVAGLAVMALAGRKWGRHE